MTDIVERLRRPVDEMGSVRVIWEMISQRKEAADEIERLRAEVKEWRSCARYDPLMSGAQFKGWDRSQMDRCRKKYIDAYGALEGK